MALESKNNSREEKKEFEERVIHISRVSKTVKGGKNMRFAALVVIGDRKGRVGKGIGKSTEVPDAIRKALTDICCTSSNALQVVESIPQDREILFVPDKNLGSYIQKVTGRQNMILWDGACHVHEKFSKEGILELKKSHPEAKVVVHPECRGEVAEMADYCGSTAGILSYCGESECDTFIVVTEPGILAEMEKRYPQKKFIPAPSVEGKSCNECEYMKMITLDSIIACLENESPTIELDEQIRQEASRSIEAMVKVG